jgi:O-antigen ligase
MASRWVILVMLVLIPLVFPTNPAVPFNEYKSLILHLGAVILAIILALDSIWNYKANIFRPSLISSGGHWLRDADRTIMVGVIMLGGSYLIATVLSPSPRISFLGFSENYSGNSGYDVLSLVVVFVSVIIHARKLEHMRFLLNSLAAVATVAAIYGLLQVHGWDGIGSRQELSRPVSSFGNTLNFAGFLVVSIPITLFIGMSSKRPVWWSTPIGLALGVQLAALWLTGGRAAIASTFISSLALAVISIRYFDRQSAKLFAVTLLSSIAVSLIIVLIPSNIDSSTQQRLLSSATDVRGLLITDEPTSSGGLQARRGIWEAAITSSVNPSIPSSSSVVPDFARIFVGVGPDMFGAIFPISTKPILRLEQQYHPHNVILNIWVSTGFFGLASLAVLALGLARIGLALHRRSTTLTNVDQRTILATFALVTLVSKFLEMQASVPRVSDLLPTMVVLGIVVAAFSLRNEDSQNERSSENHSAAISITLTFVVTSLILIVTFVGFDLRRVSAIPTITSISSREGIESHQSDILRTRAADIGDTLLKVSESHFIRSQKSYDSGDLERAYDEAIEAWELMLLIESVNPYQATTQLALAKIALTQVERGDESFAIQAKDRYLQLAIDFRGYPTLVGTAATAMASLGEYNEAIRLANRAIGTESTTKPWAKAWYAKGISEYFLGDVSLGLKSLITATNKEPGSSTSKLAHKALSNIYEERGDEENAQFHATRSAE